LNCPPALVLTYHSISSGPAPLCIPPSLLEQQLDALDRAGHEGVSLGELVDRLERGSGFDRPVFVLTFDDGYLDFASTALPILERRRLTATLFVTASRNREALPGGIHEPLLPLERLSELAERGIEIGGHSASHVDLTRVSDTDLEYELTQSRDLLAEYSGRAIEHFAYPFGRFDQRVRSAVQSHFRSACAVSLARVTQGADRLAIPRVDAHYLRSPLLRFLLSAGHPDPYLKLRRWIRRMRGSEPRHPLSAGSTVSLAPSIDSRQP